MTEKRKNYSAEFYKNYEFTIQEVRILLEELNEVFEIVRLVDPNKMVVNNLLGDSEKTIEEEKNLCFSLWDKKDRCENCTALKALLQSKRQSKLEMKNGITYNVVSYPFNIIICENKTKEFVIEIVNEAENGTDIFNEYKNYVQRLENIREQLYGDEVSRAYNRKYFDEMLFISRKEPEEKNEITFIAVDINDFKKINDEYGFSVGDSVLKEVADTFYKNIRTEDSVIRMENDDFLLTINTLNYLKVEDKIKELDKIISEIFIVDAPKLKISCSYGHAKSENLIAKSDEVKELYAKALKNM